MTEYKPRRILVTGGAGFIGSHFVRYFLKKYSDIEIFNLDALTYAGSLTKIKDVLDNKHHHFIQGNITDRALIKELFTTKDIDTVVHFAAESHVDRSILVPDCFIQTNIVGTFNLIDVAKDYWLEKYTLNSNLCRFHHVSTDEVYGSLKKSDLPSTETSPYQPRSPYSASKASSDFLVNCYFNSYQLPITLSNCSNNFGSYQNEEKFIPTIILSCLKKQPIPVYGDGSNIRDWLYVVDHCQAIDKIIRFGRLGESYNIGGDNELSNLELTKLICHEMDLFFPNHKPHRDLISFVKDRPGHDWRYAIDSSKIQKELKWYPSSDFNHHLSNTIKWYIESFSLNTIKTHDIQTEIINTIS